MRDFAYSSPCPPSLEKSDCLELRPELKKCHCSSSRHGHPQLYWKCPQAHPVLLPALSFPASPQRLEMISLKMSTSPCISSVSQAEFGHIISWNPPIKPRGRYCDYLCFKDDSTEAQRGAGLPQATQLLGIKPCSF